MNRFTIIAGIVFGLTISMIGAPATVQAQKKQQKIENPDVVIEVKGLACPFCAYGLEKKLKNLDGVQEVYIGLDEGIAQIKVDKGKTVSEEAVKNAVSDAGFTPEKITYSGQKSTSHIPQSHEREA